MQKIVVFSLSAVVLFACGDGGPNNNDAGHTHDGGHDGGTDGGGGADGGDGGNNNCTPITCDDTEACGTYDDGCEGTITCTSACECTDNNFETACESRPCENLTGCSAAGTCEYSPVVCGAQTCAPAATADCAGGGCEGLCQGDSCTTGLYPCGDGVCATVTQYCDPGQTIVDDKIVYANSCVSAPEGGCGTCGLGVRACDSGNDRFTCNEPPNPVTAGGGTVECDSTKPGSTYLYVDPNYTGGNNDGSRAQPFTTYTAALSAAQSRNARGIVIAGSPTFQDPLIVSNGISVYGGFGAAPDFNPDRGQRPRWDIDTSHYNGAENQLVGARAVDITNGTVLFHLEIQTDAIATRDADGSGASNIALLARNAPELEVNDVILRAGHAADGQAGSAGAVAGAGQRGGDALGRVPGGAGSTCASTCTLQSGDPGYVATQGNQSCGYGGHNTDSARTGSYFPLAGNPGSRSGSPTGGSPGNTEYDTSSCSLSKDDVTAGTDGAPGVPGDNGPNGARGSTAGVSAQGVYLPNPGTNGGNGLLGSWGGGGGGGGTFDDGCTDDPWLGGVGGGGGGPGCGGEAGERGLGGGASIALVAAGSAGLTVTDSTLQAGDAGDGGGGGAGAAGGGGGTGANGECQLDNPSSGSKCGGNGGNGGAGGTGGHAGGGSGGHSVGIWCVSSAVSTTGNTVTVGASGTGGSAAVGALQGDNGASVQTQGCL